MFIQEAIEIQPKYKKENTNVDRRECVKCGIVHRMRSLYFDIYVYKDNKYK